MIHATAIVDPKAELDSSVTVGPYTVIGAGVRIGAGTSVGPHCVIEGPTTVGRDNKIFQFASLGAAPQDKKYAGEPTQLIVGDRNTIREFCTMNRGTVQDDGITALGDDNWIMAYVHLAHDCKVGNRVIMANNAQLAGHVHVGDWAILGGFTAVHQFVHIGAHSMTGLGSILFQDLPPFIMAAGNTAEARSFNLEGLKRRGFTPEQLNAVKQMYRLLYRRGLTVDQAQIEMAGLQASHPEARDTIQLMLDFLKTATRGIIR
ncbi:acyl-ACP--UDP-N-acetylglucosamine O-acyltransferase [Kinneretia asaccharophila]|uniref:Acyl-[acyl-carrier-protein]--UDP-N-acetylglucosamine O-acyltransferase n=1 Tax=Roseateles asaccharophilus TaxID=582607 RepID=A0A4R6N870_9BURK|nr:acyl-ACP--UDP-N-acetylglucosamine O-acyltransferase [Roseateles asaccharophilus]MDN3543871.1 acyl-ACP--UDP-N-acetylglucosamine O-acyltransferase [Roseateles asaccharophilus]TDP11751.1 acyl-[acyl-carrier-protein]--UDP-N-acetylglucosamine O-acyltransferase [Roseateles asaccharophilus]